MSWQIGKRVVCDRPNQCSTDGIIRAIEADGIIIFCREINTVICGRQADLERLGWQIETENDSDTPMTDDRETRSTETERLESIPSPRIDSLLSC